jgi:ribonucleoside-diphosphate reductase alpha chain
VKSLYYLRSKSVQRAAFAGADAVAEVEVDPTLQMMKAAARTDYDECLACQ